MMLLGAHENVFQKLPSPLKSESTAQKSKFHVLGLRSYVMGLSLFKANPRTILWFIGLRHAPDELRPII